jgi:hypothetical protein
MIAVVGIVFVLWLAAVALLAVYQRKLLYPTYAVAANEAWAMPGVTRVVIHTADGERLRGCWKPPAPGGSVVVTFHGNASSVAGHRLPGLSGLDRLPERRRTARGRRCRCRLRQTGIAEHANPVSRTLARHWRRRRHGCEIPVKRALS